MIKDSSKSVKIEVLFLQTQSGVSYKTLESDLEGQKFFFVTS